MNYQRRAASVSEDTQYGQLEIGKDYLVMGIISFDEMLCYLINDGVISACPAKLFEVLDGKLPLNWYFNLLTNQDTRHPYIEAIWGYHELCFIEEHYLQLIEGEDNACRIYYRQKIEIEKSLSQVHP